MFSVNEYYWFSAKKTFAKTTRCIQRFSTLDEARVLADSTYSEVSRIPESESVWIGVMDESAGRIVYSQPEGAPAKSNT
ncbi:MAG: hypothetical protein V4671_06590 [Armatimonadota bacterium]